jgi:hypothetical protein
MGDVKSLDVYAADHVHMLEGTIDMLKQRLREAEKLNLSLHAEMTSAREVASVHLKDANRYNFLRQWECTPKLFVDLPCGDDLDMAVDEEIRRA